MIGNQIKHLRDEKDMSQLSLSVKLGVSQESVSLYERNLASPSAEILVKIAEVFNVSVDYLLGLDSVKKRVGANELDSFEVSLLSNYRKLSQSQKELFVKLLSVTVEYYERRM